METKSGWINLGALGTGTTDVWLRHKGPKIVTISIKVGYQWYSVDTWEGITCVRARWEFATLAEAQAFGDRYLVGVAPDDVTGLAELVRSIDPARTLVLTAQQWEAVRDALERYVECGRMSSMIAEVRRVLEYMRHAAGGEG